MKEKVTRFNFEDAFKALDEIEAPKVQGIKANRVDIHESIKRVDRTSMLVEDYYNVEDQEELSMAKEEREEEVAKAKLARIEKIVDLDADSPEDLLPSYVGKTIVQCPQCMTLFYKNEEDLVKDENDPEVVNVNEPCQHCGNVSGYSVIGKVAEAEKDELDNFEAEEEFPVEEEEENELDLDFDEEPVEEVEEEVSEEPEEEKLDLKDEEEEEEKKEESFVKPTGSSLVEQVEEALKEEDEIFPNPEKHEFIKNINGHDVYLCKDCKKYIALIDGEKVKHDSIEEFEELQEALTESADEELNKKLEAHNKYIIHIQEKIGAAEKELAEEKNEEIKKLIEKTINAYKEELEAALPEAVKEEEQVEELPDADEVPEEAIEGEEVEEEKVEESLKESVCPECGKELKPGEEPCEDCKKELEEEKCCEDQCAIHKAITHPEEDMKELKEADEEVAEEEIEEVKEELPVEEVVEKIEEVAEEIKEVVEADKEVEEAIDEIVEEKVEEICPECEEAEEEIEESCKKLHEEDIKLENSEDAIDKMLHSKEFKKSISENEVEKYFDEKLEVEELHERSINKHISDYLKEVYSNVNNFEATGCSISGKKLVVEGVINFNSGKAKNTCFEFLMTSKDDKHIFFEGCNKDLSEEGKFNLNCFLEDNKKTLMTESLGYKYSINGTLVEGLK